MGKGRAGRAKPWDWKAALRRARACLILQRRNLCKHLGAVWVRSSRSRSGPRGCAQPGAHTHTTCSFSFPVALRASGWGQSQHIFFAAYSPDASDKWSSQAGYRDSILVSASAGNDGLESHLSDSKLTCRFSPLAIRILENKGGREGSRH